MMLALALVLLVAAMAGDARTGEQPVGPATPRGSKQREVMICSKGV